MWFLFNKDVDLDEIGFVIHQCLIDCSNKDPMEVDVIVMPLDFEIKTYIVRCFNYLNE